MNFLQSDEISQLLGKYNFNIDLKLHHYLTCGICKNLLQNAYQTPCGCKYCFQCLLSYFNDEEKCCPGNTDKCKNQNLNMKSLYCDNIANKKISLIKVSCPVVTCHFASSMLNIKEHIDSHSMDNLIVDLNSDKNAIDVFDLSIDQNNVECNSQQTLETISQLKKEILLLREHLHQKEELVEKLSKENVNLTKRLDQVNENNKQKKGEITQLRNELSDLKIGRIHPLNQMTDNDKQDHVLMKSEKKAKRKKEKAERLHQIEIYINQAPDEIRYAPFYWRITNLSEKILEARVGINTEIFSEPFYSKPNGYQMILRVDPCGCEMSNNTFLSVFFSIIIGDNDHLLKWPMKQGITISLLNQNSGLQIRSQHYKYESLNWNDRAIFDNPSTRTNIECVGTPVFIPLNELMRKKKFSRKNSILLRCDVD